jgi:hypothetical protein
VARPRRGAVVADDDAGVPPTGREVAGPGTGSDPAPKGHHAAARRALHGALTHSRAVPGNDPTPPRRASRCPRPSGALGWISNNPAATTSPLRRRRSRRRRLRRPWPCSRQPTPMIPSSGRSCASSPLRAPGEGRSWGCVGLTSTRPQQRSEPAAPSRHGDGRVPADLRSPRDQGSAVARPAAPARHAAPRRRRTCEDRERTPRPRQRGDHPERLRALPRGERSRCRERDRWIAGRYDELMTAGDRKEWPFPQAHH